MKGVKKNSPFRIGSRVVPGNHFRMDAPGVLQSYDITEGNTAKDKKSLTFPSRCSRIASIRSACGAHGRRSPARYVSKRFSTRKELCRLIRRPLCFTAEGHGRCHGSMLPVSVRLENTGCVWQELEGQPVGAIAFTGGNPLTSQGAARAWEGLSGE
ncbi:hypothetical protein TRIP_B200044 [uncultured Desulfatiglans sp.]|uniref:Uncharacterized protein n=1 Tax=Uncultured Desulfatiglans sp. TaxID=1748965 RepID=A0A653A1M8_UNCDX|nr:hypothetical protein TRIP_B200044 [uncultured Desulfatiglans sp.]